VAHGGGAIAAGQHELFERRQWRVQGVELALEPLYVLGADAAVPG
jgi:hypothetical protein